MGAAGVSVRDIEARRQLLGLARLALEAAVIGAPAPKAAGAEVFDSRAGAFVTLEHTSQLRGCIGQLERDRRACPGRADDPDLPAEAVAQALDDGEAEAESRLARFAALEGFEDTLQQLGVIAAPGPSET